MNGCKFGWIYVIGKWINGIDGRDGWMEWMDV